MNRAAARTALFLALIVLSTVYWAATSWDPASTVGRNERRHVAGISADGAPAPPPISPSAEWVVVKVNMTMLEASFSPGLFTPIDFRGSAEGALPGASDPPIRLLGGKVLDPHPTDLCMWFPEYTDTPFEVQAYKIPGFFTAPRIAVDFFGPEWHFKVDCPGGTEFRAPAFAERSLPGWLGLISQGTAIGPTGHEIQTDVYNGQPTCLRDYGKREASDPLFGSFVIKVYVVNPGCDLSQAP
jgi:hypothetical protein